MELMAEGARYASKEDWRRAARACREAIALRPDEPAAYHNLGVALNNSEHDVEAAQRFLEAKERWPVGSVGWAGATAEAFIALAQESCAEVAKPEWWNDEELKALSARVVRAAPDDMQAHRMRAAVLTWQLAAWEAGPRSAAELMEAAVHFERAAALCPAPAVKASLAGDAAWYRATAGAV
jgi:tetratricopeptide (TPR) repeat protein